MLLAGPAGTGKSRGCLEKLHLCAQKYDGMRGLMLRKTLVSLTGSGLVTYRKQVRNPGDGVRFFGGNREEPAQYRYANGSVLVMAGLDKASKALSTEYDMIYVQEATELVVAEWETLTTRARYGVMPYQQILADCNPDAPTHWLKQRCDSGATTMLVSRHEDNPRLHDGHDWTEEGHRYIALLDALTGVRKERLRYGRWVAAEGVVYDEWDAGHHIIDRGDLPPLRRYVAGVDWGYTNPGVLVLYGMDGDGRLYQVREVYRTQKLIDWWVEQARAVRDECDGLLEAFVCDPSEPAFIRQFREAGLPAIPGFNDIRAGVQGVQQRIHRGGDGHARLYVVRDALGERDEALAYAGKPWSMLQERSSYVWPKGADGKPVKEIPVDLDNHGQDAERYVVAHVDGLAMGRATQPAVGDAHPAFAAPAIGRY